MSQNTSLALSSLFFKLPLLNSIFKGFINLLPVFLIDRWLSRLGLATVGYAEKEQRLRQDQGTVTKMPVH